MCIFTIRGGVKAPTDQNLFGTLRKIQETPKKKWRQLANRRWAPICFLWETRLDLITRFWAYLVSSRSSLHMAGYRHGVGRLYIQMISNKKLPISVWPSRRDANSETIKIFSVCTSRIRRIDIDEGASPICHRWRTDAQECSYPGRSTALPLRIVRSDVHPFYRAQ